MPELNDPAVPYVGTSVVAEWLGITPSTLWQRVRRARAVGLSTPPPVVDPGAHQAKVWHNDATSRRDWQVWNRRVMAIGAAVISHPRSYEYSEQHLRRLWVNGVVTEWIEDLASIITELIKCRDPAAAHIDIPGRPPTGRLKAINPDLDVVNLVYINNLRAWARELATRLLAADATIRDWPARGPGWEPTLRKYLSDNWVGVLHRCAKWEPRKH